MKKTDVKDKKRRSIRVSLLTYFALFALITLAVLWVLLNAMLDFSYRTVTLNRSRSAVAQAVAAIQKNPKDYASLNSISEYYNACILLYGEDFAPLCSCEVGRNCVIHKMSPMNRFEFYTKAVQNGGTHTEIVKYIFADFSGERTRNPTMESVLTVSIFKCDDVDYVLFYNAVLTPVTSVVQTLNVILGVLTVIMLGVAAAIALIISRRISTPLTRLTESAKQLATGDYATSFDASSAYKEIAQLGDTLNYTARELSKVDNLKTELIANVSHDLRTPLTLIGGYGEVMRDIPGENNAQNAQLIVDEAKRLSTIVSDTLDMSQLQSGAAKLSAEQFCITDTLASITRSYNSMLREKDIQVELSFDEPLIVEADETKISRVVYNLINNAVAFTGEDKTVRVGQKREGNAARITVSDSGKGIPQPELEHIFERYYKSAATKRTDGLRAGSGLGLPIVKAILDLHKAPFGIISGNTGTTFWFELPIAD